MKVSRLLIVEVFFLIAFVILGVRIYSLQISNNNYYAEKAQAQQGSMKNDLLRKPIYFTDKFDNNIPVVLNKEFYIIFAVPKEIKNDVQVAKSLSPIVGIDYNELIKRFSNKKNLYSLLISKATDVQVEEIRKVNIKGIYIRNKFFRYYPYGSMGAQLLGFASLSNNRNAGLSGKYGVEKEFNTWLNGNGDVNFPKYIKYKDGLHLTIDINIQAESEKVLENLIEKFQAKRGSVIVEDPYSGKILAMVSLPSFNPNDYYNFPVKDFMNPNIEYVYEAGSVFKIFTMSAGINTGAITPETKYYDSGLDIIDGRSIRNWDLKAHGIQTMTNVLEKSLNTGAIFAEKKTGNKVFTSYIKKYGFGKKTDILLPGEVTGDISNLNHGREINYATASFGQGVSVTPIQLITAVAVTANGGLLMKPIILQDEKSEVVRRVISNETANKVSKMLISAVDKAYVARIPNYKVAGKTGTANIPNFVSGGYTKNVIDTYVGYAPVSNPKFVLLVKLDKAKGNPLGGRTVVPAFRKIARFILNYYNVPPDRIEK